jgi:phospholipid N-methyltransferase
VLVIQYSPLMQPELRKRFGSVRRRMSVRNVPPAFLFACREPGGS